MASKKLITLVSLHSSVKLWAYSDTDFCVSIDTLPQIQWDLVAWEIEDRGEIMKGRAEGD